MEEKIKVLKMKVGTVFIDGKSRDVFDDLWQKVSKKGEIYYESRRPIFVKEITRKDPQIQPASMPQQPQAPISA